MIRYYLLFILSTSVYSLNSIIPQPIEMSNGTESITIDRCSIQFPESLASQTLEQVHHEIFAPDFPCSVNDSKPFLIYTKSLGVSENCTDESYELLITKESAKFTAKCYTGIVRAYSSFLLLFEFNEDSREITLDSLPIQIKDAPRYSYRGLMIDTARHYLKKSTIFRILHAMTFCKLNVFHWHISDDESFPMESKAFPNLTKSAAYSESMVYTVEDINEILMYAKIRGIRVIPEINTPSHTRAIGLYGPFNQILTCFDSVYPININKTYKVRGGPPTTALDPTMNETYDFIKGILSDLDSYFPDEFIHFGGSEVSSKCWDERPFIKKFMKENNITDYLKLKGYYMTREHNILKEINPFKRPIQWLITEFSIKYDPEVVLQYCGNSINAKHIKRNHPNNKIILSPFDYSSLNCEYNNGYGSNIWCGKYPTWARMYSFEPTKLDIVNENILGGEVCGWTEAMNDYTLEYMIWPRSAAFSAALWEHKRPDVPNLAKVLNSLMTFSKILKKFGINTSPLTSEYCELHSNECFEKI